MTEEQRPETRSDLLAKIDSGKPHPARVWNYWLGGKDNYPADREAGDKFIAAYPQIVTIARQARQFLRRSVTYLAGEAGVRQFLDIGTGLPTVQSTHEVAQAIAPDARVVYVDNDPLVLVHARALLTDTTPEGVTTYVDADVREPELIISDARNVLNFDRPIAVILMGILGHAAATAEEMHSVVRRLMAAVPSGSYLVLHDGVDVGHRALRETNSWYGYHLRTPEEFRAAFDGLELVEPGLVPINVWRPDPVQVGTIEPIRDSRVGVARKP